VPAIGTITVAPPSPPPVITPPPPPPPPPPPGTVAPFAPTAIGALAGNNRVTLNWTPSVSADVTEQRVYRSLIAGTYTTPLPAGTLAPGTTQFIDLTAGNGTVYFYILTAFSTIESLGSAQVSAMPLNPVTNPPYNPFTFDWGVAFMGTPPTDHGVTLDPSDDYDTGALYPVSHNGGPQHGWLSLTHLTRANVALGPSGYTLDVRNMGRVTNDNDGTPSVFQVDLSTSGLPDADGTRTFAVILAIGRPDGPEGTGTFVEIRDGHPTTGTFLDDKDSIGSAILSTMEGYGGTSLSKGLPETDAVGQGVWPNDYVPQVLTFATTTFTLNLGKQSAGAGTSSITYVRLRRIVPSAIAHKALWEVGMTRMGHWWGKNSGLGPSSSTDTTYNATVGAARVLAAPNPSAAYSIAGEGVNGLWYYDGLRVAIDRYLYTRTSVDRAIVEAYATLQSTYYLGNDGHVPALNNFTTGLRMYWQLTRDETGVGNARAQAAVTALATNASFSSDSRFATNWTVATDPAINPDNMREISYALTAKCDLEIVTGVRNQYLTRYRDVSLSHLDQACASKTYKSLFPGAAYFGRFYIDCFMVANCMIGLIEYAELTGNVSSVLAPIRSGIDFLWTYCWIPNTGAYPTHTAFFHENAVDDGTTDLPFPVLGDEWGAGPVVETSNLSLLIVQPWGWYYHQTGDTTIRDQGDAIFEGGVNSTSRTIYDSLYQPFGKLFQQNYIKSFNYVRWRDMAPLA
jgi:hypothetical protein